MGKSAETGGESENRQVNSLLTGRKGVTVGDGVWSPSHTGDDPTPASWPETWD